MRPMVGDNEDIAITKSTKPTAADIVQAMRLYDAQKREEEASRSAQERLVMGAFGSWIRHRWKWVTGVMAVAATLGGGGWKGWQWVQLAAEERVLARQDERNRADAVEQNTVAMGALTTKHDDLTERVESIEHKVEATSQINQVLLQLQLRDPKIKRLIKADNDLKQLVSRIPGVTISE